MAPLVAPYLVPVFLHLARRHHPDVLWQGEGDKRLIALTFDDGPGRFTPELLDALRQEKVPATFFVLGDRVERRPDLLRRTVEEGHLVALHGYEHRSPRKLSEAELSGSVHRNREVVEQALGARQGPSRWFYRPPYGHLNRGVVWMAKALDLRIVLLSILPGEHLLYPPGWRELPATTVARVKRAARPGAIVCLHDGEALGKQDGVYDNPTIAATALAVIRELKNQGYAFTTVDAFVREGNHAAR